MQQVHKELFVVWMIDRAVACMPAHLHFPGNRVVIYDLLDEWVAIGWMEQMTTEGESQEELFV